MTGIMTYIPVYTVGPRDMDFVITWFSIRLHYRSCATIKTLEQMNESSASKFIIYTDSLSCLHTLHF